MSRGANIRSNRTAGRIGKTALVAAGLAMGGSALAQEGSALLLTFGINSKLSYEDNPDLSDPAGDSEVELSNKLSFGLSSETRNQTLRLSLSGDLRFGDVSESDEGLDDPTLDFLYRVQGSRSQLSLTASYKHSELSLIDSTSDDSSDDDTLNDVVDDIDDTIVVGSDSADRIDSSVGFQFITGLDRPLRFTLTGRHSEREFRDTDDPDLFDSQTDRLAMAVDLQFSSTVTAGIRASTNRYSAEDTEDTERRTDSASLTLSYQIDEVTSFNASLGQTSVETTKSGVTSETDGASGSVSLSRELPRGTISLSYARSISSSGANNTVSLGRSFTFPAGSLRLDVGVTEVSSGTISLVGSASYSHELKRGQLDFGLTRSVNTDSDGDDVLRTRASLGANYQLTQLTSVSMDFGFARVEDGGAGSVSTANQVDANLALNRSLTEDWALSAGYRYKLIDNDGGTTADSNAVFVSLGRTFQVRP